MRFKLIEYVDGLFPLKDSAQRELHDEILQNTLERYDEEIENGKSESEAYAAAISAIGDINELLQVPDQKQGFFTLKRTLAIGLYVLCLVPAIIGSHLGALGEAIGASSMFLLASTATFLLLSPVGKKGSLFALGIALYVVSVIPPILLDAIPNLPNGDIIGACCLLLIAAVATVLVIQNHNRREKVFNTEPDEKAEEDEPVHPVQKILTTIYWLAVVGVFLYIGNRIGWQYAWLIFPFAGALGNLVQGIVLLCRKKAGGLTLCNGLLWFVILSLYCLLTFKTGKWMVTWLIFPIGGALSAVLSGIFDLVKGYKK